MMWEGVGNWSVDVGPTLVREACPAVLDSNCSNKLPRIICIDIYIFCENSATLIISLRVCVCVCVCVCVYIYECVEWA